MDKDLQQFIEENVDLIEIEDFESLYKKALSTLTNVGRLAVIFLSAGIDPLEKLTYVPRGYLWRVK